MSLLRCIMRACSVAQSCSTLGDSTDCSPAGSSVLGIFQVRIQVWIAVSSSKGSSLPCLLHCRQILYLWATGEVWRYSEHLVFKHVQNWVPEFSSKTHASFPQSSSHLASSCLGKSLDVILHFSLSLAIHGQSTGKFFWPHLQNTPRTWSPPPSPLLPPRSKPPSSLAELSHWSPNSSLLTAVTWWF